MQNDFFKKSEPSRAPIYLEYDYHSLLTVNKKNLNPGKDLIFRDLLFEQFFPKKPGTQVQL